MTITSADASSNRPHVGGCCWDRLSWGLSTSRSLTADTNIWRVVGQPTSLFVGPSYKAKPETGDRGRWASVFRAQVDFGWRRPIPRRRNRRSSNDWLGDSQRAPNNASTAVLSRTCSASAELTASKTSNPAARNRSAFAQRKTAFSSTTKTT
jgi:hypothetical protein